MTTTTFLRLLDTPIPQKGTRLRNLVDALNRGNTPADTFPADTADFSTIPGSPFAYWVDNKVFNIFPNLPSISSSGISAQHGASTKSDFRFLRIWWEIPENFIGVEKKWIPFAKGGKYSPFYGDLYLLVNWENNAQEIKEYLTKQYPYLNGETGWILHPENSYFQPGVTWTRRTTSALSVRVLPSECIFSDKGPAAFTKKKDDISLMALLAVMNSKPFLRLVELRLGAASAAARSYEDGLIQQTPIPNLDEKNKIELAGWSLLEFDSMRSPSLNDETTHVFCLPSLVSVQGNNITERQQIISKSETERQNSLSSIQAQIDARVAELYGVPELLEIGEEKIENGEELSNNNLAGDDDEAEDETPSLLSNPYSLVSDLLSWCVGVAFGRWDVRYALHPETLPSLPEPFDPLPVCSPGMLQGTDGLPLTAPPNPYPLSLAPHGFLVDDPDRPEDDIVAAVRRVLRLIWGEQADAIESEACQILDVPDLRVWFRDPKGFFDYHIKRYSKSRRKAPIYWMIQSARKNYAIWLYYPRLNHDSLFFAAREYADAKLNLESARLEELQAGLAAQNGANRKVHERRVAAQGNLVAEIKSFLKALDSAALLELDPDLNDGVLLNIAPLHELVPWKEAERAWNELLKGQYAWSHIADHLRKKRLVKGNR